MQNLFHNHDFNNSHCFSRLLDRKLDDTYISVYFYTGSNATKVGSYDGVEVGTTIPEPEEPVRPKFFFLVGIET